MMHIFDLDNTLVYTDQANRSAYNKALQRAGLDPITSLGRITRKTIQLTYPNLDDIQMQQIISDKQTLFPLEETVVNTPLVQYIKEQDKKCCMIWTSADYNRTHSLLQYHGLDVYFSNIFFSKKRNIDEEFQNLIQIFSLKREDLIIYEDTDCYIEKLRNMNIMVIDIKTWSANAYL